MQFIFDNNNKKDGLSRPFCFTKKTAGYSASDFTDATIPARL